MDSQKNKIIGHVVGTRKEIIKIQAESTGRTYAIICKYAIVSIIHKYDKIIGYHKLEPNGELSFISKPLVEPPTDEYFIKSLFYCPLQKKGIGNMFCNKVYQFFTDAVFRTFKENKAYIDYGIMGSVKCPIYRNKDKVSYAVVEMICSYAEKLREDASMASIMIHLGISEDNLKTLLVWWYQHYCIRRLYLLGLDSKEIEKCCKCGWEPSTLFYQIIENPYIVEKITAQKAQDLCSLINIAFPQIYILCSAIVRYIDNVCAINGWICCPIVHLNIVDPNIFGCLTDIFSCTIKNSSIYLRYMINIENIICSKVKKLSMVQTDELTLITPMSKSLTSNQARAVSIAMRRGISLVSGSAGTGKTHTISALVSEINAHNKTGIVCSFTGKSVSYLKMVIGQGPTKAMTLHGLIHNWKDYDYIIVDDASIISSEILALLMLKINPAYSKLVLFGDIAQLPPIDPGQPFIQLLQYHAIPKTKLEQNFRTRSEILSSNLAEISKGSNQFNYGHGCILIEGEIKEVMIAVDLMHKSLAPFKVITPYKNIDLINNKITQLILPNEPQITDHWSRTWKKGAIVMVTEYHSDLINGEEGIIADIDVDLGVVTVQFIDRIVDFDINDKRERITTMFIRYAWCVTIHKSLSSQYENVILYLPLGLDSKSLNRNLFYTAVSRAQNALCIVSPNRDIVAKALEIRPIDRVDYLYLSLCQE